MKTLQWLAKAGVVFLMSVSLLGEAVEGILIPKGSQVDQKEAPQSDRRQSIFPVSSNPPRPSGPVGLMPVPSRELLPPLVSPPGPVVNSIQPGFVNQPPPAAQQEKFELLPPVEIPPERPIEDVQQQQPQGPNPSRPFFGFNGNPGGVFQEVAPPVLSNQLSPTSFIPTTGPGNSGGSISNRIPVPVRPSLSGQQPPTRPIQSQNFDNAQQQLPATPDPGLDCLGRCQCPQEFNFVCGNNRYLYQNDCALECDKECHPGLLKVGMDQCSRKR